MKKIKNGNELIRELTGSCPLKARVRQLIQEAKEEFRSGHGDGFVKVEGFELYSYYGSDALKAMTEANFEAAYDCLGGQKAEDKGWIKQTRSELFVYFTQPLLLLEALKLKQWVDEDYPLIDESLYSEKERDQLEQTWNCYRSDFESAVTETASLLGINAEDFDDSELESIAHGCLETDLRYRGLDDAFVDSSVVQRCLRDCVQDGWAELTEACGKSNKLLNAMIEAMKNIKRKGDTE